MSYVNSKIEELDNHKHELVKKIAEPSLDTLNPKHINEISNHLNTWDKVDFYDKWRVVDLMNSAICTTSKSINIVRKI